MNTRYSAALVSWCVVLTALSNPASAFSSIGWITASTSASTSQLEASSRREMFVELATGSAAILAVTTSLPLAANADVTNKIASSSALRYAKRSQKQLEALELYVSNGQYQELKQAIRVAPLAEVRKNGRILLLGGEDNKDAEKLNALYKKFIQGLEDLDGSASLGIRGKDVPKDKISRQYQTTTTAFADFITLAEESVTIPL